MKKRKPRVVVDTNLLVSGLIFPRSTPYLLLETWRNKEFVLVTTQYLLRELETVLNRPKFQKYNISIQTIRIFLEKLSKHKQKVPSSSKLPMPIRDQKDEDVLLCALYRKVDYLVTGDKDLLTLKNHPGIYPLKIITANEFIKILEGKN